MIQASISNVLGCHEADFPIEAITLLAGRNGQGKSSIIAAVAAALLNRPKMRQVTNKSDFKSLVTDGAKEGTAMVRDEDAGWQVFLSWPKEQSDQRGSVPAGISPFSTGAANICSLSSEDRIKALSSVLVIEPTREQFDAFLKHRGITSAKALDNVWMRIQESGWDNAAEHVRGLATEARGAWKQVTGETYGDKKAEDWQPPGRKPDYTGGTDDELDKLILDARDAVEAALRNEGSSAEKRGALKDKVEAGEKAQEQESDIRARIAAAEQDLESRSKERQALPADPDALRGKPCPHCGEMVDAVVAQGAVTELRKAGDNTLSDEEADALASRIRDLDAQIAECRQEIAGYSRELDAVHAAQVAGEQAQQELDGMTGEGGPDDTQRAREKLADLRAEAKFREDIAKARTQHARVQNFKTIYEALEPGGVRSTAFEEGMAPLREQIRELQSVGKGTMPEITIDAAGDVRYGGRLYQYLSGSEKHRCFIIITLALAVCCDSPIVLVDELEMIQDDDRTGIFLAMHQAYTSAGVNTLCALMKPESIKPIGAQHCHTFWVEGGRIGEVTADAA